MSQNFSGSYCSVHNWQALTYYDQIANDNIFLNCVVSNWEIPKHSMNNLGYPMRQWNLHNAIHAINHCAIILGKFAIFHLLELIMRYRSLKRMHARSR